ncbi:hypothetical protein [Brachyspira hyodysenteriae]|uniref:hypothetical protein n=1 Tax=Brachyspira hyodysenteriae TaxID=159 RepID=UPI003B984935
MKTLDYLKLYDNNNSNLIIQYLEYIKLYKSKSTLQTYSSSIKNFYDFLYFYYDNRLSKNIQLYNTTVMYNKVDRKCIEDYIAYQVNKNLSADVIHCRVMAVKNYFKYLAKLKKNKHGNFF